MKQLENKTAIITGASRGIGKGIAEKFAQEGCNIAFSFASSVEKAKALEEELSSTYGVKVKGFQSNAASFESSQRNAWLNVVASANPSGMYLNSLLQCKVAREQSEDTDLNGCGRFKATDLNRLRAVALKSKGISTICFAFGFSCPCFLRTIKQRGRRHTPSPTYRTQRSSRLSEQSHQPIKGNHL